MKKNKPKEPVKIRFKKLENGNKSIYLDIYKEGARHYEFLKIYIIPEKTPFDKVQNKNAMTAATAIKAQRISEIINGKGGIKKIKTPKVKLSELFDNLKEEFPQSVRLNNVSVKNYILKYDDIELREVTPDYIRAFLRYLRTSTKLKENTINAYYARLRALFNIAKRRKLIELNPCDELDKKEKPKYTDPERSFLSVEELKKLIETPCKREDIKTAFIFSCFCGLRISDIYRLKWENVHTNEENPYISIKMKKTKKPINVPLSANALQWLPAKKLRKEVFYTLPSNPVICKHLEQWAKDADIDKDITFHTSRHTCATMLLSLGANVYTIKELLGHSKIETTQIYAKVIDESKKKAVNLTDGLF